MILILVILLLLSLYCDGSNETDIIGILKKRLLSLDQYITKKDHGDCNVSKFVKITEIPYGRRYLLSIFIIILIVLISFLVVTI